MSIKITDLPDNTLPYTGSERTLITQAGETRSGTLNSFANYLSSIILNRDVLIDVIESETLEIDSIEYADSAGTVLVPSISSSIILTNKNGKPHCDTSEGTREIVTNSIGTYGLRKSVIKRLDDYTVGTHVINVGSFSLPATVLVPGTLMMLTGSVCFNIKLPDFTLGGGTVNLRLRPDNGTHNGVNDGIIMPLVNITGGSVANIFMAAGLEVVLDEINSSDIYVGPSDFNNGHTDAPYLALTKNYYGSASFVGGDLNAPEYIPWFTTPVDTNVLVDIILPISTKPTSASKSFLMCDLNLRLVVSNEN